jgi:hypothetical protein
VISIPATHAIRFLIRAIVSDPHLSEDEPDLSILKIHPFIRVIYDTISQDGSSFRNGLREPAGQAESSKNLYFGLVRFWKLGSICRRRDQQSQ